jgi:hypothetical protein
MAAPEFTVEGLGLRVTITRSAGADRALVVFIDGPGDNGRDVMPNGEPRVRVLLNDEPVFAAVPYEPIEEE